MKSHLKLILLIISTGALSTILLSMVLGCKLTNGKIYDADNGIGNVKSQIIRHFDGYYMTIFGYGYMSEYLPIAWQDNLIDLTSGWKITIQRVIISEGVKSISNCAFCGCKSLNQVNVPCSMLFIGSKAFAYCDELKKLYYDGTVEEWLSLINHSPLWNDESYIDEIICLDGVWSVE